MSNPVLHFEVGVKDGKAGREFYSNMFGWNINSDNPMGYSLVNTVGEGINGGIAEAEEHSGVVFYVQVDGPQAALDKAVSLGGKVVVPVTEIPAMVTMAQFSDPEGNVIGAVKAMCRVTGGTWVRAAPV